MTNLFLLRQRISSLMVGASLILLTACNTMSTGMVDAAFDNQQGIIAAAAHDIDKAKKYFAKAYSLSLEQHDEYSASINLRNLICLTNNTCCKGDTEKDCCKLTEMNLPASHVAANIRCENK